MTNSAEAVHSFHFNGVVLCFVYQNYLCLAKFVHTNTVYSVYIYLVNFVVFLTYLLYSKNWLRAARRVFTLITQTLCSS